ncbi:MAG: transporter substrate-binding protein [Herbinix sp.]|jgi:ABC-type glycerol-3-phosphate transport system substrate-binding protein|nr:transporter substrate-binding protein [Herbinix sp.]
MNNLIKKLISVLLILVMAVSFTACNKSKNTDPDTEDAGNLDEDSDGGEQDVTEEDPDAGPFDQYTEGEEVVDLEGYKFKVVDFHQDRWAPEEIKSPMDELVVSIIDDVETTFNCDIEFENVAPDVIFETAQPEIMTGGKYADLVGTTVWAFGKMLGGNLLVDLKTIDSLDLNQPYFFENVAKTVTFGDKTYAFGAPFGSHMGATWIMYYNTRIWDELGYEDPVELVNSGKWTWDKMVEYAKGALRDNDGDGIISTDADRWGITSPAGDMIRAMYASMEGYFYKENEEGKVRLSCLDAVSAEKINFMYQFFQKDNIMFKNENVGYLELFSGGKSLFMMYMGDTSDLIKNMEDDFGILPLPKWNEQQANYQSGVDHNAPIFSITNSNPNTYEAGIIIDALARRYQATEEQKLQDYIDTYWRLEEDESMMRNYILGHGSYDVINVIKNANSNFDTPASTLFGGCYWNNYSDIVSTIASTEEALNLQLDDYFSNLSK